MRTFTITYSPTEIAGECGYAYEIYSAGRRVRGGWSRGKKYHAEQQARQDVRELEAKAA